MNLSPTGYDLVRHFEGCQLTAYQDEVGIWTIGYGHTGLVHNDGTVHAGRVITMDEAVALLEYDMRASEATVTEVVKVPLQQCQFDALVSFEFNTGGGALRSSTLLRNLNNNLPFEAAAQFPAWCHAGGKALAGLVRRRNAERDLFCSFGWDRWKT